MAVTDGASDQDAPPIPNRFLAHILMRVVSSDEASYVSSQEEEVVPKDAARTTIALPEDLLNAVDRAVGEGKARSRNAFVAAALQHELEALERVEIDAAFAEMASDAEYAQESEQMLREFASADWEALRSSESTSSENASSESAS